MAIELNCPSCGRQHLSLASSVSLRALTMRLEPGLDPLVGSVESQTFIEVEPVAMRAIQLITEKGRLADAADHLFVEHNVRYDILDLVAYLVERDLVAAIDGCAVPLHRAARGRGRLGRLAYIPARAVQWMHAPTCIAFVASLALIAGAVAIGSPNSRVGFSDLFPFSLSSLNLVALIATLSVNLGMHELAHVLMAKSFGVDAGVRLSRRAHFIVLETDVTNAWLLPKRERVLIFLAGMGYNVAVGATAFLGAAAVASGILPGERGLITFLRFAAVAALLPLLFQLLLWMRTDLYFVLAALTGARNLHADAKAFIGYKWWRLRAALRGELSLRCGCGGRRHIADPFCSRCGQVYDVEDPNKFPFKARARRLLFWYGLAALLLTPAVTVWGLHRTAVLHAHYIRRDAAVLRVAIEHGDGVAALASAVSLFVVVALTLLLAYLLARSTLRVTTRGGMPALKRWFDSRAPARALASWVPRQGYRVARRQALRRLRRSKVR